MKPVLLSVVLLLLFVAGLLVAPASVNAQDLELRSRAVALLEHAHAVSLAANIPSVQRVDTFRVLDASGGPREGSFSRVTIQGMGRREEIMFGDFQRVEIWTGNYLRWSGQCPPHSDLGWRLPEVPASSRSLLRISRALRPFASFRATTHGEPAHCIEFDTIVGESRSQNELCVSTVNGTLISEQLGDDFIENSDFSNFAGALYPGHILYSAFGHPVLEITQSLTPLDDTANVLASPSNARIGFVCKTVRQPIGLSMPQPPPGRGGRDTDVVIRAFIGTDGHVHEALVQSSPTPDLDAEALSLVAQWTFQPEMCNGKPNQTTASLVLHFHGR